MANPYDSLTPEVRLRKIARGEVSPIEVYATPVGLAADLTFMFASLDGTRTRRDELEAQRRRLQAVREEAEAAISDALRRLDKGLRS